MHFSNLLIIKIDRDEPDDAIKRTVDRALEGSSEENGGWWDWFQIGGRWTGFFDGYDPKKDPKMKGNEMWPTEYPFRRQDCIPIEKLTDAHIMRAYAVVMSRWGKYERFAGEVYHPMPWSDYSSKQFIKLEKPPAEWLKKEYPGYLVVVVDSHI